MSEIRLTIKPGSGRDSTRWLWFVDAGGDAIAEGMEDSSDECFAAAAVTVACLREKLASAGFKHTAAVLGHRPMTAATADIRRAEEEMRREYPDGIR